MIDFEVKFILFKKFIIFDTVGPLIVRISGSKEKVALCEDPAL